MYFLKRYNVTRTESGFTLIEGMTVVFLVTVIVITFYEVYTLGARHILNSRNRLGAVAVANQKMEMIRSLEYDSIGTKKWNGASWQYGIPPGDIVEEEPVAAGNTTYTVHTFVQYIDDAYDGTLGGSPNDLAPTDYKRVRVTVSWGAGGSNEQSALVSTLSPVGVESVSNTGILSINTLDSAGVGIAGVSVHIINTAESIDITTNTDATGNVLLPGAPPGDQNYELSVSKGGYYGGITYPPYPLSSFNPLDIHSSVVVASVNQKSLVIDTEADITIRTEDPFGTAIPTIDFGLAGGRQIGVVPGSSPLVPVWDFSTTSATNGSGTVEFENESYGRYTFTLDAGETGYKFWKVTPELSAGAKYFDALPGEDKTAEVILLDVALSSLLVTVKEDVSDVAIAGASVRLSNVTLGYDVTLTTDIFGLAFFPTALPALAAGTYDFEVTATGYTTETGTVLIGGSTLEEQTVELTVS